MAQISWEMSDIVLSQMIQGHADVNRTFSKKTSTKEHLTFSILTFPVNIKCHHAPILPFQRWDEDRAKNCRNLRIMTSKERRGEEWLSGRPFNSQMGGRSPFVSTGRESFPWRRGEEEMTFISSHCSSHQKQRKCDPWLNLSCASQWIIVKRSTSSQFRESHFWGFHYR